MHTYKRACARAGIPAFSTRDEDETLHHTQSSRLARRPVSMNFPRACSFPCNAVPMLCGVSNRSSVHPIKHTLGRVRTDTLAHTHNECVCTRARTRGSSVRPSFCARRGVVVCRSWNTRKPRILASSHHHHHRKPHTLARRTVLAEILAHGRRRRLHYCKQRNCV